MYQTAPGHIAQMESTICKALAQARKCAALAFEDGNCEQEQVWVDIADALLTAFDLLDDAT